MSKFPGRRLVLASLLAVLLLLFVPSAVALPPVVTVPGDITVEATGPTTTVSWSASANDPEEGPIPVVCTPTSGSAFFVTSTIVTCTATDSESNVVSETFTVTVEDTTPPSITTPGNITVEATGPSTTVTYSADATDAVGVNSFSCTPGSGAGFSLGPTTVDCDATDGSGNSSSASFTITVEDTTPPDLSVPSDLVVEATGPSGAPVNWPDPSATDPGFGPVPPSQILCDRLSGSKFPLGTTTVNCSANDGHGNTSSGAFKVKVVDTTPPVLPSYPKKIIVYEDTNSAVKKSSLGALFNPKATDIVDGSIAVDVKPDLAQYPLGSNSLTFSATDAAGNTSTKATVLLEVRKVPVGVKPGTIVTKIDLSAPARPKNFRARPGDHKAKLSWNPVSAADFRQYVVTRTSASNLAATGVSKVVYRGKETQYVDRKLKNNLEYRYEIVAEDKAGNRSAVSTAFVTPRAILLAAPKLGANIRVLAKSKKVKFRWAPQKKASYYNLQLFLIKGKGAKAEPIKIGTFWPNRAKFTLNRQWTFEGKRYKLKPGWRVIWYVWPGYGRRAKAEYGNLIGKSDFKVLKAKKKTAKS